MNSLDSDLGDPISSPPGPYTVQPEVEGRFLWLTGAPGMGKSTTAQLLARNKGSITVMFIYNSYGYSEKTSDF